MPQNRAYCCIGDYQGLIISFPPGNLDSPPVLKLVPYNGREHNTDSCSNTLSFVSKNIVALITANPTQNKDIGIYIYKKLCNFFSILDKRSEKNNVYIINYDTFELTKLDPLGFSIFTVPFDFDGNRIV